jgi:hypothetical protein
MEPKYIKFIDPRDSKKYFIFEYVRGTGEMATYRKGRIIGKKTAFDVDSHIESPVGALKHMVHRGHKLETYTSLDELEAELFMEAFEDF